MYRVQGFGVSGLGFAVQGWGFGCVGFRQGLPKDNEKDLH